MVLFEAQLPTFPSVIQPPLSFKWGNTSRQQIATLSEGVARLALLPHAGCPIPRYWIPLAMRERRKQSRCPIPEIQDSDDYEARPGG